MASSTSEGPVPLGPDDDIIWFARGRLAVLVPRTVTGGLEETVRRVSEWHELIGQRLALAVIIKDDMDRPGEEMRKGIQHTLQTISPMLVCNSITVLGTGFFRSFFMSLLSRIFGMLQGDETSRKIHTDLESAANWIHERLADPDTSVSDILTLLRWAEAQSA